MVEDRKDTKETVLGVFQKVFPAEFSIKEASKRAKLTRETMSKYIGILVAEGELKATKKVGNTKLFLLAKPDPNTLRDHLCKEIEDFLPLAQKSFGMPAMKALEEALQAMKKGVRKEGGRHE